MYGRLIVIEGNEGAGKSTLISGLTGALQERGLPVRQLREPGGTELGELLRAVLKGRLTDISYIDDDGARVTRPFELDVLDDRAEALLFAAARAQIASELIAPALTAGEWVIVDRFVFSSLVYQGIARGLGVEGVRSLSEFALGGLTPDRVLLLDVSAEVSLARRVARDGGAADRIEAEGDEFLARVRDGYRQIARLDQDLHGDDSPVRIIDADQDRARVFEDAYAAIADLLPEA